MKKQSKIMASLERRRQREAAEAAEMERIREAAQNRQGRSPINTMNPKDLFDAGRRGKVPYRKD